LVVVVVWNYTDMLYWDVLARCVSMFLPYSIEQSKKSRLHRK
jgi:hypothetical protein